MCAHIPKMDVALVEGSVCINDKLSVQEIKETREKAASLLQSEGAPVMATSPGSPRWSAKPACTRILPANWGSYQGRRVHPRMRSNPPADQERLRHGIPAAQGNHRAKGSATAYLKPLMMAAKEERPRASAT